MEAEDVIPLAASGSDGGSDRNEAEDGCQVASGENLGQGVGELVSETEGNRDVVRDLSNLNETVEFTEIETRSNVVLRGENDDTEVEEGQLSPEIGVTENTVVEGVGGVETVSEMEGKCDDVPSVNGCVTEIGTSNGSPIEDGGPILGVKRTRTTFEEQQPSVHVKYCGLSRQSKRKLEELLRQWSEWNAQNSSLSHDQNQVSESGEGTYFPALNIGIGKASAVSFWVENEIRKPKNEDFVTVDDDSVPLYDRGFALGLTSADGSSNLEGGAELLDAPRCFNCGSYSHSLKECPKPRDNAAVNNSRKQLKSKRNQTAGMRNPSRYYQDSPGGKYEGLKPGVLDTETRRLLGLGEFDPPPWLNRMREVGYPPGYLEPEDEDLPSGITIYADEEIKEEKEEGEILEAEVVEPSKKMAVKFPGINAPIPQNADEWLWAAKPFNSDRHRNGEGSRSNSRGHRDFKDEDPLGFDRSADRSRYAPRYNDYDSRGSRENALRPRSPGSGRSLGERSRNDPLDSEDSLAYGLYSSFSYSSGRRFSDNSNGSDISRDYSSRNRDRDDRHRHRSGR